MVGFAALYLPYQPLFIKFTCMNYLCKKRQSTYKEKRRRLTEAKGHAQDVEDLDIDHEHDKRRFDGRSTSGRAIG